MSERQMSAVAGKNLFYFLKTCSICRVCSLKGAQFTFIFDLGALLDLANYLAGICQIESQPR